MVHPRAQGLYPTHGPTPSAQSSGNLRKKCGRNVNTLSQGKPIPPTAILALTLSAAPPCPQIVTSPAWPAHRLGPAPPVRKAWGWTLMGAAWPTRNVAPPSTGMRMLLSASPATLSASTARGRRRTSVKHAPGSAFFSVSYFSSEEGFVFPSLWETALHTALSGRYWLLSFWFFAFCLGNVPTYRKDARVRTLQRTAHGCASSSSQIIHLLPHLLYHLFAGSLPFSLVLSLSLSQCIHVHHSQYIFFEAIWRHTSWPLSHKYFLRLVIVSYITTG